MRYDAKIHADLKSRETQLRAEMDAIAQRMHDRDEAGEGAWTPAKTAADAHDRNLHTVTSNELDAVRGELYRMDLRAPRSNERQQSVMERFLRGGHELLGEADTARWAPTAAQLAAFPERPDARNADMIFIPADNSLRRELMGTGFRSGHRLELATDDTAGRNLVPVDILEPPVDTLDFIGDALSAFRQFNTATGNPARVPQFDDASKKGSLVVQGAVQNPAIATVPDPTAATFISQTMRSGAIDVPMEAIRDTTFDLTGYAVRQAVRRLRRGWNELLTTNAHNANPQGAIGTAKLSSFETASNAAVTWQELARLRYEVNRAYRVGTEGVAGGFMLDMMDGMIGYMISDSFEYQMTVMADSQQRPLYLPSVREMTPATFNGYPVIVNGDMAAFAADTPNAVAFGNWATFGFRKVGGTLIYRFFDSNTADKNAVQVMAFDSCDGRVRLPLSSNQNPGAAKLDIKA